MIHSLEDLYDDMGISHDITNIWVFVFFNNFGPVLVLYVFHVFFGSFFHWTILDTLGHCDDGAGARRAPAADGQVEGLPDCHFPKYHGRILFQLWQT
jgi:hypothetical protein